MATQSKPQTTSEAALSAVEAVILGDGEKTDPAASPEVAENNHKSEATGAPRLPSVSDADLPAPARETPSRPPTRGGAANVARPPVTRIIDPGQSNGPGTPEPAATSPRPAANDDRRSVGQILQALQMRPSRTPLVLAFIAAGAWIALSAFYGWTTWQTGELQKASPSLLALLGMAVLGPVIFFFITAMLARRTQEIRHTARSLSEVAIRLAEPETVALEQVVTLSGAIRREVASMGDGIERALARAGELETHGTAKAAA